MKLQVNNDYTEGKPKQPLYKEVSHAPEVPLNQRQFQILEKPNLRIYCSGCELEITRHAHICAQNDYYCITCFSNLEEYPAQYIVRPCLKRSFTQTNWDLMDQVILTTAFRLWGYSNWRQIQEFMDYNQSPFSLDQIKQHYEQYHYFQPEHLISLPKKLQKAHPHTLYSELALKRYQESPPKEISLRRIDSKGEKRPSSQRNLAAENQGERGSRPASMGNISALENDVRHLSTYLKTESSVLGYNAKRGEFETCYYDVQAERMLDDLEFYDSDTPEEFALKIEMIEEYNRRLDERAKRKEFVLDYKLLDSHCQLPQSQEQQQATVLFQPLMRFTVNYRQYREMVDAFSTIKKEQSFITDLIRIRNSVSQSGTLNDAFDFLTKKRKKSVLNWEKRFGKKFEDKRRRKIYVRSNLEDGTVVLKEENEHHQDCPIPLEQISAIPIEDIEGSKQPVTSSGKMGRKLVRLETVLEQQRSNRDGSEGSSKDGA